MKNEIRDVSDALDELRHAFAYALEIGLKNDWDGCQSSSEMLAAYEQRLIEIKSLKRVMGAST
jgi:hypothetical protein